MNDIVSEMTVALEKGESVAFCCIVAAFGSSPRKAGTKMAVFADGHTVGTVGGGRVEYLVAESAKKMLPNAASTVITYDLEGKTTEGIGMVCGGAVTIAFKVFLPTDLPLLQRRQKVFQSREEARIRFDTTTGDFDIITGNDTSAIKLQTDWRDGVYTERLIYPDRVLLFGGGHVGRALIPVLSTIGFAVTLLDARPELAKPENYPCAEKVICSDFAHIDRDVAITPKDYVVVMTPGHRADFDILAQVIPAEPAYIGCMGSKRKAAAMRETLLDSGFTVEQIDRVHSPIGMWIMSETPEEIAISIAAEMIEHRAKLRAAGSGL